MKLLEYSSKEVLKKYGIPVKRGKLVRSVDEALEVYKDLGPHVAVKAQVPVGGRGKAGGIRLAKSESELKEVTSSILGMEIKGIKVKKVLVEGAAEIEKEFYVGVVLNRNTRNNIIMVSAEGGVEIEEVAREKPEAILKISVDPGVGLPDFKARELAFGLGLVPDLAKKMAVFIKKLYELYINVDAQLAEINPLVVDKNGELWALDAKIIVDDNALFRHPDIEKLRDMDYENRDELEAKEKGLSFVKLEGNIGCCVNGAGLAMATMDIIKLYGGEPANFLDVGGSSNPDKIRNAMRLIFKDPSVKAIYINIFGGITRCDDVAKGLIQAFNELEINVPVVIRLTGTNEDIARKMLNESGLPLHTAATMAEGAKKVTELATSQ